jgi:hypothetical protein
MIFVAAARSSRLDPKAGPLKLKKVTACATAWPSIRKCPKPSHAARTGVQPTLLATADEMIESRGSR